MSGHYMIIATQIFTGEVRVVRPDDNVTLEQAEAVALMVNERPKLGPDWRLTIYKRVEGIGAHGTSR